MSCLTKTTNFAVVFYMCVATHNSTEEKIDRVVYVKILKGKSYRVK